MPMIDAITQQVVSLAVAAVFGVLTGYLASRLRAVTKRDRAIEQGIGVILRRELMEDYETYVINGHPLTVEHRREIDECWEAYHEGLGLNGSGAKAYEALCGLDMTL